MTIFVDEKKNNGELKNIYLKKETDQGNFQITYAKRGYFVTENKLQVLVLIKGQNINKINDDLTTFNFEESSLNMSNQDSGIIKIDKIQETSTLQLLQCVNRYQNYFQKIKKNDKEIFIQNCTIENLDNIFKELYKRLLVPLYIPTLILCSLILLIFSKENINYTRHQIYVFMIGFVFIIFSETTQKLIKDSIDYNLIIFIIPILIFLIIYSLILYKINFNPNSTKL